MPAKKQQEEDEDLEELEEAPKPKKRISAKEKEQSNKKLKQETRHTVLGIVLFALAIFFVIAGFGGGGIAGGFTRDLFKNLFGVGYALIPIIFAILGVRFMKGIKPNFALIESIAYLLLVIGSLGLIDVATTPDHMGGYVGLGSAWIFIALFDNLGATLFLGAILIISLIMLFDTRPTLTLFNSLYNKIAGSVLGYFENKKKEKKLVISGNTQSEEKNIPKSIPVPVHHEEPEPIEDDEEIVEKTSRKQIKRIHSSYVPPPIDLLEGDKGKPNVGDVKANANIIKRSLSNFGIEVEMDEVTIGPSVTRYAFKPAEGVKLSRILGLQNDLALALAAHPIRIEAPIPGKSLVGIEIPNKVKSIVGLANLLSEDRFVKAEKPLTIALGRGLNGMAHLGNMAKTEGV